MMSKILRHLLPPEKNHFNSGIQLQTNGLKISVDSLTNQLPDKEVEGMRSGSDRSEQL